MLLKHSASASDRSMLSLLLGAVSWRVARTEGLAAQSATAINHGLAIIFVTAVKYAIVDNGYVWSVVARAAFAAIRATLTMACGTARDKRNQRRLRRRENSRFERISNIAA